jgi:hypothetical protein
LARMGASARMRRYRLGGLRATRKSPPGMAASSIVFTGIEQQYSKA